MEPEAARRSSDEVGSGLGASSGSGSLSSSADSLYHSVGSFSDQLADFPPTGQPQWGPEPAMLPQYASATQRLAAGAGVGELHLRPEALQQPSGSGDADASRLKQSHSTTQVPLPARAPVALDEPFYNDPPDPYPTVHKSSAPEAGIGTAQAGGFYSDGPDAQGYAPPEAAPSRPGDYAWQQFEGSYIASAVGHAADLATGAAAVVGRLGQEHVAGNLVTSYVYGAPPAGPGATDADKRRAGRELVVAIFAALAVLYLAGWLFFRMHWSLQLVLALIFVVWSLKFIGGGNVVDLEGILWAPFRQEFPELAESISRFAERVENRFAAWKGGERAEQMQQSIFVRADERGDVEGGSERESLLNPATQGFGAAWTDNDPPSDRDIGARS